jgi:hypothetical protein
VVLVESEGGTLNNLPEAALNVRAAAACLVWLAPRRRRGSATSARSSSLDGEGGKGGEGGGGTGDAANESDSLPAAGTPLQDTGRSDHPRKTPATNVKAQLAKYCTFVKSGTMATSATMVAAAAASAVSPAGVKLQSRLRARCWCNTATNTANCYWLLICTAAWQAGCECDNCVILSGYTSNLRKLSILSVSIQHLWKASKILCLPSQLLQHASRVLFCIAMYYDFVNLAPPGGLQNTVFINPTPPGGF